MSDRHTYSRHGAECPYCGHMNRPEDSDGGLYDEGRTEWECNGCEKEFRMSVYVSHSWTCEPMDDET